MKAQADASSGYGVTKASSGAASGGISPASASLAGSAGVSGLKGAEGTKGATAAGATGTGAAGKAGAVDGASGATGTQKVDPAECETCKNRKYQDISTDAGVSFKAPANIDPSVAASAVLAHEQEHVSLAEGRAAETDSQVISSITLETAICEECGRVFVSGGKAHITTITPNKEDESSEPVPGMKKPQSSEEAMPGMRKAAAEAEAVIPGMRKPQSSEEAMPGMRNPAAEENNPLPVIGNARMATGGTDQFKSRYMQSMAQNYGLFINLRA